jgi:hypothetical protein
MRGFWRENWIWIVAPIVLVIATFVAILCLQSGDEASPFTYHIF